MSDEPQLDLRERLDALDPRPSRARGRSTGGTTRIIAALLGLSAIWGTVLVLNRSQTPDQALATAEPEEFQTVGSGWELMPTQKVTPEPIPVAAQPSPPPAAPTGPSESELAMIQTLADLRAELDAMREAAANRDQEPRQDAESAAQIERLSAQITALTGQTEDMQDALEDAERLARQRELEAERLRAELQLAQSSPPSLEPLGPTGLEAPPVASSEAERLAALEARRAQAEADRLARIRSPLVAFGGSGAAPTSAGVAPDLGPNEEFLRAGARATEVEQATVIANPSRTVIQGTVIQAALETAIDSDLPGAIRAVVSEDVHSYDGTRILIPRGSKLIGRYNSQVEATQRRLMVAWDRIITPDGQSVTIAAYGADELGRSGTDGRIDRRLGTRFGSAALVSLISALPSAAAASVDDPLAAELAEELGGDVEDASRSVLDEYLSVAPTITVDQGARITVMVDRDLELS